jgi:hypothetical protein
MIFPFGDFFCRSQALWKSASGYTSVGSLNFPWRTSRSDQAANPRWRPYISKQMIDITIGNVAAALDDAREHALPGRAVVAANEVWRRLRDLLSKRGADDRLDGRTAAAW